MRRGGFTLIECVLTLVILAVAVPATLAMMHDATVARTESVLTTRASWLGSMLSEQILADIASEDPSLGMQALADATRYLESPATGLYARLEQELSDYASLGLEATVQIGPLITSDGEQSGDPDRDIYRQVTVVVEFSSPRHGPKEIPFAILLTDTTP
jgi:prepilin-type N-terminal cleavage/methylation domain-containing protein